MHGRMCKDAEFTELVRIVSKDSIVNVIKLLTGTTVLHMPGSRSKVTCALGQSQQMQGCLLSAKGQTRKLQLCNVCVLLNLAFTIRMDIASTGEAKQLLILTGQMLEILQLLLGGRRKLMGCFASSCLLDYQSPCKYCDHNSSSNLKRLLSRPRVHSKFQTETDKTLAKG
ncbi:hypothetical protein ABBQ38_006410 [Trebouxia sp. C0009 RCD-2024]